MCRDLKHQLSNQQDDSTGTPTTHCRVAKWGYLVKEMRDKLVEDEIATVEDVEQAQAEIEAYSNDSVMSALQGGK